MTFNTKWLQLYQKTGLELCVVATNLTTSVAEYCHPKTTPDMSVALAVKASCSSPGVVPFRTFYDLHKGLFTLAIGKRCSKAGSN